MTLLRRVLRITKQRFFRRFRSIFKAFRFPLLDAFCKLSAESFLNSVQPPTISATIYYTRKGGMKLCACANVLVLVPDIRCDFVIFYYFQSISFPLSLSTHALPFESGASLVQFFPEDKQYAGISPNLIAVTWRICQY